MFKLHIKHKEECYVRYPNTESSGLKKKTRRNRVILTYFKVFGYLMKHSFECLI